jgi:hypothetical protein
MEWDHDGRVAVDLWMVPWDRSIAEAGLDGVALASVAFWMTVSRVPHLSALCEVAPVNTKAQNKLARFFF